MYDLVSGFMFCGSIVVLVVLSIVYIKKVTSRVL